MPRLICGAVTGGLWVSTNGGTTWSQVDDWWHNLSVGALTMDPGSRPADTHRVKGSL